LRLFLRAILQFEAFGFGGGDTISDFEALATEICDDLP
jgi:hypothetical protein